MILLRTRTWLLYFFCKVKNSSRIHSIRMATTEESTHKPFICEIHLRLLKPWAILASLSQQYPTCTFTPVKLKKQGSLRMVPTKTLPMIQGPISLFKTKMFIRRNVALMHTSKNINLKKVNSVSQDVNIMRKEWLNNNQTYTKISTLTEILK